MCIDAHRGVLVFNRIAETMFGCPAAEAIGIPADRFFSERFLRLLDAHLEGGPRGLRAVTTVGSDSPVGFRKDGTEFVLDAAISRVDGPGGPVCTLVLRDVTELKQREGERAELLQREQAARSEAEQAAQQSWLLAEASRMLTVSVDYMTTLAGLARLAAGTLADWCVIDLVGDDGALRRLAVAHADPAREPFARGSRRARSRVRTCPRRWPRRWPAAAPRSSPR